MPKTVQLKVPLHCVKSTSEFQSSFRDFFALSSPPCPFLYVQRIMCLYVQIIATATFLLPSKRGSFRMLKYSAKLLKELSQKNMKY